MKKVVKVMLGILVPLIILWTIIFFIDYSKCAKFEMPIFVVAGETVDDGGTGTYYGLGYRVEVEKKLSAEYGAELTKIEMYLFNKFIIGAIADMADIAAKNPNSNTFVGTVLEETTTYMVVEPNTDEVNVTVDNKTMPLEDALRSGKVTIDKIVSNANRDLDAGKITGDMYKEGGTMEYHYENFTVIKSHSLDGNRDVYIGVPEMRLNDVR